MKCTACPVVTSGLNITVNKPDTAPKTELPKADFLIITWTDAETDALAKIFGSGKCSYKTLTSNTLTPLKVVGIPLPESANYHGFFFQCTIATKSVVACKCNFHPKMQTTETENLIKKIIGTAGTHNYKYVITSGTAGGIWDSIDVGDVVVTNAARFGLTLPAKKNLRFTGVANVKGSKPDNAATWFDYVNANLIKDNDCVAQNLFTAGGRATISGKPKILYQSSGSNIDAVVTNSHINNDHIDEEKSNLSIYKTMGASLDENDAFAAESCKAIGFANWVSIRNISDLPRSSNANQYTTYEYCSSINGAYAVWAFIMGH
jgi:hypothetical protein